MPSFLRFGRFLLRVWHANQTSTCRKCNRPGHVVKNCPNVICFNCEGLGHTSHDCKGPVHCSICRDTDHMAIDCKFSWHRRPAHAHDDVDDQDSQDAARAPPAASHIAAGDTQALASTARVTPMDDDSDVREESSAAAHVPPVVVNDVAVDDQDASVVLPTVGDTGSSSCTIPGDSAVQPSPSSSDQQLAAAASAASDEALAAMASAASDILLADLCLSPDPSPCASSASSVPASPSASPVLFSASTPASSAPVTSPDLELVVLPSISRGPPPVPPDDLLIASALKQSKPKIKPKPIGRQPGRVDNTHAPPSRKSSKSSVIAPRRKDSSSS